jgi:hypothetical protein
VTEAPPGDSTGPEQAARAHAERIVGRDARVQEDLAPGADVAPPDLLEWLLERQFRGFELVAHARIGAHHIFKTKFIGPTTLVVQARWAAADGGRWCIREAEVARVEDEPPGPPTATSGPAKP